MARDRTLNLLAVGLIVAGIGLFAAAIAFREPAAPAPVATEASSAPVARPPVAVPNPTLAPGLGAGVPRKERSVLLITVDTTRADHLGPYGATFADTPNLDTLARQGIVFEKAYSVAPITLVAHTSILTGLYPPSHGVRNNGIHYVRDDITSLAEVLAGRGYRTSAFVSAAVLEKRFNLDQGFELYDDDLSTGRERHPRMVADRPAGAAVDAAWAWLDELGEDESFFTWVHFYDPHAAYSPPAPYRDKFRNRLYDGEIAYMDSQIGRLFTHPRLAPGRDVVVAVIGDHGESLGEHGENTHALLAYDSTLHVPFLLKVEGGPAGLRVPLPVSQVDYVPTVLDLLGAEAPADLPGASLVPTFGGGAPARPVAGLYSETYLPYYTYGWAKLKVLRNGSWKFIDAPTPELFDVDRDPHEVTNVVEQSPSVAHDLRRDLGELLARVEDAEAEATLEVDDEMMGKLVALGYAAHGSRPAGDADDGGVRPDPKDLVSLHTSLEKARRFLRDQLFEQAEAQLRSVLARDPGNLAALTDLASALEGEGKLVEAIQTVEKALALDPGYVRLYLTLSGLENRRGNTERAIELLDLALELDPQSLEAKLQKAVHLGRLGDREQMAQLLDGALAEHPDHPRLNAVYAQQVDLRLGKLDRALERVDRALERDPFLVLGWRLKGSIEERRGRHEAALEAYGEGLKRAPDDADLHGRRGMLLARMGRGVETEVHLREAIRLGREFRSELHVALGAWLAENGRIDEAEAEYARVLAVDPGNPGARNNRAIAFYRTGRLDEASAELEALVEVAPQHADALNNIAAIALDKRDWAKAEDFSRRALEVSEDLPEAWNNLGIALDEQERYPDAVKQFERALEIMPTYWKARNNLAITYRKMERFEDAAASFQEVLVELGSGSQADIHLELGDLYAGPLADPQAAKLHYNAALRVAPNHPRAQEVRETLATLPVAGGG